MFRKLKVIIKRLFYKAGFDITRVKHTRFEYSRAIPDTPAINRIVSITPAGRKRNLAILGQYLLKQRGVIDEHVFWLNTENQDDVEYILNLCKQYPDFFKVQKPKIKIDGTFSIYHFFRECQDEKTLYIRFDDDICFVEENAVKNLIDFRLRNPYYFLVFGNIVNNAICGHLHQRFGSVPLTIDPISYNCVCPNGWQNPLVAEKVHEHFLLKLKNKSVSDYFFDTWVLNNYERFSINFFAWFGRDFSLFNGEVGIDEEDWLTTVKPFLLKRPNVVCGNALVSHFAFFTQRDYLETKTNILSRYKEISEKI